MMKKLMLTTMMLAAAASAADRASADPMSMRCTGVTTTTHFVGKSTKEDPKHPDSHIIIFDDLGPGGIIILDGSPLTIKGTKDGVTVADFKPPGLVYWLTFQRTTGFMQTGTGYLG